VVKSLPPLPGRGVGHLIPGVPLRSTRLISGKPSGLHESLKTAKNLFPHCSPGKTHKGYCRFARALKYGPIPCGKGHPH